MKYMRFCVFPAVCVIETLINSIAIKAVKYVFLNLMSQISNR